LRQGVNLKWQTKGVFKKVQNISFVVIFFISLVVTQNRTLQSLRFQALHYSNGFFIWVLELKPQTLSSCKPQPQLYPMSIHSHNEKQWQW